MLPVNMKGSNEKRDMIIDIEYEERFCDICNSNDLESLLTIKKISKTISKKFRWNNQIRICKRCGFVFLSPVPTKGALKCYYQDHYPAYSGQKLDYSIENRIDILKKHP